MLNPCQQIAADRATANQFAAEKLTQLRAARAMSHDAQSTQLLTPRTSLQFDSNNASNVVDAGDRHGKIQPLERSISTSSDTIDRLYSAEDVDFAEKSPTLQQPGGNDEDGSVFVTENEGLGTYDQPLKAKIPSLHDQRDNDEDNTLFVEEEPCAESATLQPQRPRHPRPGISPVEVIQNLVSKALSNKEEFPSIQHLGFRGLATYADFDTLEGFDAYVRSNNFKPYYTVLRRAIQDAKTSGLHWKYSHLKTVLRYIRDSNPQWSAPPGNYNKRQDWKDIDHYASVIYHLVRRTRFIRKNNRGGPFRGRRCEPQTLNKVWQIVIFLNKKVPEIDGTRRIRSLGAPNAILPRSLKELLPNKAAEELPAAESSHKVQQHRSSSKFSNVKQHDNLQDFNDGKANNGLSTDEGSPRHAQSRVRETDKRIVSSRCPLGGASTSEVYKGEVTSKKAEMQANTAESESDEAECNDSQSSSTRQNNTSSKSISRSLTSLRKRLLHRTLDDDREELEVPYEKRRKIGESGPWSSTLKTGDSLRGRLMADVTNPGWKDSEAEAAEKERASLLDSFSSTRKTSYSSPDRNEVKGTTQIAVEIPALPLPSRLQDEASKRAQAQEEAQLQAEEARQAEEAQQAEEASRAEARSREEAKSKATTTLQTAKATSEQVAEATVQQETRNEIPQQQAGAEAADSREFGDNARVTANEAYMFEWMNWQDATGYDIDSETPAPDSILTLDHIDTQAGLEDLQGRVSDLFDFSQHDQLLNSIDLVARGGNRTRITKVTPHSWMRVTRVLERSRKEDVEFRVWTRGGSSD